MSQAVSGSRHWAAQYSAVDRQTLHPTYPDPSEYDLSALNFRSNTRDLARRAYESEVAGRPSAKQLNEHIATTVNTLLAPLLEDAITVTTTQHGEKVIIENPHSGDPNPIEIGSFGLRMREGLPATTSKRAYCNEFRDLTSGFVCEVIDEVHEYLAGLGVPPLPASELP